MKQLVCSEGFYGDEELLLFPTKRWILFKLLCFLCHCQLRFLCFPLVESDLYLLSLIFCMFFRHFSWRRSADWWFCSMFLLISKLPAAVVMEQFEELNHQRNRFTWSRNQILFTLKASIWGWKDSNKPTADPNLIKCFEGVKDEFLFEGRLKVCSIYYCLFDKTCPQLVDWGTESEADSSWWSWGKVWIFLAATADVSAIWRWRYGSLKALVSIAGGADFTGSAGCFPSSPVLHFTFLRGLLAARIAAWSDRSIEAGGRRILWFKGQCGLFSPGLRTGQGETRLRRTCWSLTFLQVKKNNRISPLLRDIRSL